MKNYSNRSFKNVSLLPVMALTLSSCSGNYQAALQREGADIIVNVFENDLFGRPKRGRLRKFCLYGATIENQQSRRVWSIQSKSGLCTEMQAFSIIHPPGGYVRDGALPDLQTGIYTLKLSIGGGSAIAKIGR
jgi:hypothetical protein